jgi:hypothetical protein
MVLAIWIVVGLAVGLWSLLGWGLYSLLTLEQQWLGELEPLLGQVPFGAWLDLWVPGWQALAAVTIDAVQWTLGWVGAAAPVAVWLVWGGGTLVMVAGGALLTVLVVLLRERPRPARPL